MVILDVEVSTRIWMFLVEPLERQGNLWKTVYLIDLRLPYLVLKEKILDKWRGLVEVSKMRV